MWFCPNRLHSTTSCYFVFTQSETHGWIARLQTQKRRFLHPNIADFLNPLLRLSVFSKFLWLPASFKLLIYYIRLHHYNISNIFAGKDSNYLHQGGHVFVLVCFVGVLQQDYTKTKWISTKLGLRALADLWALPSALLVCKLMARKHL